METEHSKMEDEGQNAPSLSLKDGAFLPSSSILFPPLPEDVEITAG